MKPETPTKQELIDCILDLYHGFCMYSLDMGDKHADTIKYCMENGK